MPHIELHPAVVHFPIALFLSALALEVLGRIFSREALHKSAVHIYLLAAFLTPFVALTGLREANELHLVHRVLDLHRIFALSTMWLALASLLMLWNIKRRIAGFFRTAFLIVLILLASFVSIAAYHGGRLVYEYSVGIEEE